MLRSVYCFISALALMAVLASSPGLAQNAEPWNVHVSSAGSDAWSGSLPEPNAEKTDGPLATLVRARDVLRERKAQGGLPEGGARVIVQGGQYVFDAPLQLSAEDSGTAQAPITYAAAEGQEVRISGGKVLDGFAPVTDEATLARLDESARGHVVSMDLRAAGITDFGSPQGGGVELFFRDKSMTLARWPNEGWTHIAGLCVEDGHQIHGIPGSKTGRFIYEGDRPSRWINESDPWVHGYWFWDWSDQRQAIASIDPARKEIAVKEPYHGYGYRKGQWYYAYNLLVELDAPGEWYIDRDAGVLYFWPPEVVNPGDAVMTMLPTLIEMKDVSSMTIQGLTLESGRGVGISMSGGAKNRIVGCTIRNIGGWAVTVGGGDNHTVAGCDIYQTGQGGISLSGGDRTTLTPANHLADNNHIHHYSRIDRMYHPAITLQGVGNRATHNLIHDAPHMGMGFGGNDHLIEFNEIYNVCFESNDAGAIYTGRNWTMRGNVLRYNYLHDISGFENKGCVGIYLDDMFASADILSNVFYNVTRAAFIGGGRDCTVANNIFVDCKQAMHVDARALGWAHGHADEWIQEAKEKGTISGIAFDKPPYSERYPALPHILEKEPKAPEGNLIARNIFWGGSWDDIEEVARPYLTIEKNLVQEDPHFVDAAQHDYRLKEDSPAFALGFEPIPIEKIGLYESPERATWPVER
ncbi:MAG: right-handed parallel beta-helix repeat-containing protein [Candidatus Hydrogenedentes bacterium]|nr:right-handed parallel beta-helix repeat-containing protein [Candidatus Hydrogenedentota bacterium]